MAEYPGGGAPGSPTREYISGAKGELMATVQAGTPTTTTYHLRDQLSVRANTDGTSGSSTFGQVIGQQGHYPYGEGWYSSGTTTKWQFTSYERDTESSMDYATARFYINRFGRFYSPDPISGSPANPQTLDLFTYVVDDPIDYADPDGTLPIAIDGGCHGDPGGTPPLFPGGGFPWPIWWQRGAGGGESGRRLPSVLIALGLIRALDGGGGGGRGRGGGGGNTWERCRREVFVPCMDAAESKNTQCRLVATAACAAAFGLCVPVCDLTPPLCAACLTRAAGFCTSMYFRCSGAFDQDTRSCYDKLNQCVERRGP